MTAAEAFIANLRRTLNSEQVQKLAVALNKTICNPPDDTTAADVYGALVVVFSRLLIDLDDHNVEAATDALPIMVRQLRDVGQMARRFPKDRGTDPLTAM